MYYPKNKILENQYTLGKEFKIINTSKEYVGYYYILSNGDRYTGKVPDSSSMKLISLNNNENKENIFYDVLISNKTKVKKIKEQKYVPMHVLIPTENDYNNGYITRYFANQLNNINFKIIEINESDFNSINDNDGKYYDMYKIISLNWVIKGKKEDVIKTNQNIISQNENKMVGISQFLYNPLQFWKF